MITFESKGDFKNTDTFLERMLELFDIGIWDKYGKMGVEALRTYTPINTGLLRDSWSYEIEHDKGRTRITWTNSDIEGGYNVALLVQYGHGNGNGGYVQGVDYINPAMKPIFEQILNELLKEVKQ